MKTAELRAAKKLSDRGTTDPRYPRTSSGWSCTASENEQKMMPSEASRSLNVVATDTLSNTASTATPARTAPLLERDAELLVRLEELRVHLVEALRGVFLRLGGGVVGDRLVVDGGDGEARPVRFAHLAPASIGIEAPLEHECGLALDLRHPRDHLLVEPRGQGLGFDVGHEPLFVLAPDEGFDVVRRRLARRLKGFGHPSGRPAVKSDWNSRNNRDFAGRGQRIRRGIRGRAGPVAAYRLRTGRGPPRNERTWSRVRTRWVSSITIIS